jgi:hypothetical protein
MKYNIIIVSFAVFLSTCIVSCQRSTSPSERKGVGGGLKSSMTQDDVDIMESSSEISSEQVRQWRELFEKHKEMRLLQCPFSVEMTTTQVDEIISKNSKPSGDLILNCFERRISDGKGYISTQVDYKEDSYFCDLGIENQKIVSVWIMEGGGEMYSQIFFRLAGNGKHVGVWTKDK